MAKRANEMTEKDKEQQEWLMQCLPLVGIGLILLCVVVGLCL
jgi:hypothetical protein